jgi:hypothetical protein
VCFSTFLHFFFSFERDDSLIDKFISINVECAKRGYEKEEEQIQACGDR